MKKNIYKKRNNVIFKLNENDNLNTPINVKIVYGKEILKPLEFMPPVSQTIEKYIKDRFATIN